MCHALSLPSSHPASASYSPNTHSIISSRSSGSASVITSSILASSVPLVTAAVVQQSVFVQFVQLHPSPHAFPFPLHPHWCIWWHQVLHPHLFSSPATLSLIASMLLSLSQSNVTVPSIIFLPYSAYIGLAPHVQHPAYSFPVTIESISIGSKSMKCLMY